MTSAITPVNQIWAKKLFKNKNFEKCVEIFFPLCIFGNPLYFEVRKDGVGGSTFLYPSDLKFMFLESLWYEEWAQGDC